MHSRLLPLTAVVLLCAAASAVAQPAPEPFWPGATYDSAIPTLRQVVGHDPGTEITTPEQVATYLRALQQAAPTRTRLVEYARTWEGRPLWLLVIGNPERLQRLDQVKGDLQKLADPRTVAAAERTRLVREAPVVVWLVHGVHGNEISSADAALLEAYHLLAVQKDADIDLVYRDALVLIDPMQNPDGRARFVFQNLQGRGLEPDPTPYNAEHDEPWPGGRSNHYLFDMNRDWFAQTQPESRGRIRIARDFWPHVTVDLHEQGGDNAYYFAPPADPLNPHLTKTQIDAYDLFGRANGRRFDERGWAYYIREVYDAFYPGYGDSWPTFNGSIGMTYEQASARGLSFARRDGTTLTYRDGVLHHFNSAITTVITAAKNRERLIREFLDYRLSAVAEGERGPVREYVLLPGQDPSRAARLARNLATQGIEVRRTLEATRVGTREVPAGAYLVSHVQPAGRLIRNLLETHIPQPEAFIKKQEERRARRQSDQIYDITAWSLPLLFDVEVVTSATALSPKSEAVPSTYDAPPAPKTFARGQVGYLLPWGAGTAALSAEAMRAGIRVHSIGGAFTLNGRAYPIGTALVRTMGNPPNVHETLTRLAAAHDVDVVPIDSTYVDTGTSLGSNDVRALKAPRVLLAWDAPTQSLSAGWTRYTLERRFGQPVTAVRVSSLGRAILSDFDVIVLPSGNYGGAIGDAVLTRIKEWVRGGGTLVTLAEATRWATGDNVGLLDTKPLLKNGNLDAPGDKLAAGMPSGGARPAPRGDAVAPPGDTAKPAARRDTETQSADTAKPAASPSPFDYDKSIQPDRERPDPQPGAILRVTIDTDHWLSSGHDAEGQTMIEGDRVFAPIKLNSGRNVGVYGTKDRLIASGLIWPENQDLLVQKAYAIHQPMGQGHVIAFAEDATYRAFSEGTMLLFMNAVLLGPGY
ncbi:MAG: peptidase M14 [Acidobacteria bacterium]|nr:peptidase M14 [Acidobacteriota bacterium]